MTLLQKLEECVNLGYTVSFSREPLNLSIKVSHDVSNHIFLKESWLPLSDHFYESKIVECIDFMVTEIQKRNK